MSTDLRDAVLARRTREAGLETNRDITKAELIRVDGHVKVLDRPGYVWAREYGQHGGVFQVFNPSVTAISGLPVLVAADPKYPSRRRVLGVDWETLANMPAGTMPPNAPYLPEHARSHERYDGYYAADPVNVYLRMLVPLRCEANTGMTVRVAPLVYQINGQRIYYGGIESLDLSMHVPTTAGKGRRVLVYLDTTDNTAKISVGALGSGVALSYPAIPAAGIPSAYVRLVYGQTSLNERDFEDARMLFGVQQAGGVGAVSANTLPACGV